ncbi:hypothetical protein GYH30_042719 [Glycine max]|nr:hypothetical protein GYH30_042719 [Glycine max]
MREANCPIVADITHSLQQPAGKKTYTGNILIAVNPIQRLPHLSATSTIAKYKGVAFGE